MFSEAFEPASCPAVPDLVKPETCRAAPGIMLRLETVKLADSISAGKMRERSGSWLVDRNVLCLGRVLQ